MPDLRAVEEFVADYRRMLGDACATGRRLTRDELEARRREGSGRPGPVPGCAC